MNKSNSFKMTIPTEHRLWEIVGHLTPRRRNEEIVRLALNGHAFENVCSSGSFGTKESESSLKNQSSIAIESTPQNGSAMRQLKTPVNFGKQLLTM